MSDRPRLAFLGVGWIGAHRMRAVAESDVADIVGVADPSSRALAAAKTVVPGVRACRDLHSLLELQPDGVVIASPSALHAAQALEALSAGAAVFCQKPLARTASEARCIVDAARARGLLLGVDLSYRHTAAIAAIRDLVGAGDLGEIYAMELVFHNAYGPDKPWFYDKVASGGGCVMDLGIHLVDLALWMLGFPPVTDVTAQLYADGRRLPGRTPHVEDYAAVQLDLATGAVAQLRSSWKLPAGRDAVIEAAFFGSRGGAAMRNVRGSFYDFVAERYDGTATWPLVEPPDDWGGRAAVHWARQLAAGGGFDSAAEHFVDVADAIDWIYDRRAE